MAARTQGLTAFAILVIACLLLGMPRAQAPRADAPAQRIVSLVPALTEMLFAIGAGRQVIAVSSYDEFPAEVNTLPKVGALLDPDTERILTLRPDMVIVYGSQTDLDTQLHRAGIRTFRYRHGGLDTLLDTIHQLGDVSGHRHQSETLVTSIRTRLDDVRQRVKGRPRPRVLLVFERQPGTLREVYASGGVGFLHEVLEIAGGTNVFDDVGREAVQPSIETLLARAPEIILEVRANGLIGSAARVELDAWSSLSSLPAVRNRRVRLLAGDYLVVPGPRIAMAAEAFARAIHPDAFK